MNQIIHPVIAPRPRQPIAEPQAAALIVLKLGGSCLRSPESAHLAAHEVYRHVRRGWRVLAVVSAQNGETDRLIAEGRNAAGGARSRHMARLLSVGELRSAALLAVALERIGLTADVCDFHDMDLRAEGGHDDASPVACDTARLSDRLAQCDAVVAPGFIALDHEGAPVSLGRGGTDLTAIFLGDALGARRIRLIKDVDGVYDSDPAAGLNADGPYCDLAWDSARGLCGAVLQPKALAFAAERDAPVEIAAPGRAYQTRFHHGDIRRRPVSSQRPLSVALLGCGVVGGGVYEALARMPDLFSVKRILVRDSSRERPGAPRHLLTENPDHKDIAACDLLIEAMGGLDRAGDLIAAALNRGQDVVTANKALIADRPDALDAACEATGAGLRFSAAVGGGVPMVERLDAALEAGRAPVQIAGVMNGTCNFILDAMAEGESLEDAIAAAQDAGFAEADPSADIDGWDAAAKLAILARRASGQAVKLTDIPKQSLRDVSAKRVRSLAREGRRLRQVADCRFGEAGPRLSVRFEAFDADHPLARPSGAGNVLSMVLDNGELLTVSGLGAGRWPTAEAMVADCLDLHRLRAQG